jgi:hypothetical protein
MSETGLTAAETSLRTMLLNAEAEKARRELPTDPMQDAADTTDFVPEAEGNQGVNLMLMRDADRRKTREFVESQPPMLQFLMEMAPATIGTMFGSVGGFIGAIGGGTAGELMGQELGISPRSDFAIGAAAGGPVAGKVLGWAWKGGKRVFGKGIAVLPPMRAALAKHTMRKAVDELEGIAMKVMASQKGYLNFEASRLYKLAEKSGVKIPAFRTTAMRGALAPLARELSMLPNSPQAKAALKVMAEVEQLMSGSSVSFGDLIMARKLIGGAVDHAKTTIKSNKLGGVNGAMKAFFKAAADDLDHLASLGGKTGKHAKIAVAASQRAKLDFAMTDFKAGISSATTFLEGTTTKVVDVSKFRNWLRARVDPDSKFYNKQMDEAFGDQMDGIMENLARLTRFGKSQSPGGFGSLIIRGSGAAWGATIGGMIAGPIGAGIGTMAGAASPEMAAAIFSSRGASKFLERVANLGEGVISEKAWMIAGQIAAQGIKFNEQKSPGAFQQNIGQAGQAIRDAVRP